MLYVSTFFVLQSKEKSKVSVVEELDASTANSVVVWWCSMATSTIFDRAGDGCSSLLGSF